MSSTMSGGATVDANFLKTFSFGRAPTGRAIRYKSSLVPRCGLFTAIPHAISA
ncbi:hypothetical protein E18064_30011 [Elizabethkingia anophelis]|nr:hypothetical protein E18064_30011 [Elizabethkingia anophelis]